MVIPTVFGAVNSQFESEYPHFYCPTKDLTCPLQKKQSIFTNATDATALQTECQTLVAGSSRMNGGGPTLVIQPGTSRIIICAGNALPTSTRL